MGRDPDVERHPPHGGKPVKFPADPDRERGEREEEEEERKKKEEREEGYVGEDLRG
jgi:hypothetical protein